VMGEDRPTLANWDARRPGWMPTAQAIALDFSLRWTEVVEHAMRVAPHQEA
jgi:hypothetical protein